MKNNRTIIKPILTEKATNLVKDNLYMFEVGIEANKARIKQEVEKLFPVKVVKVTMQLRKGKTRKVGRKQVIKKLSDRKIAYVKVREGKIDLFPQA